MFPKTIVALADAVVPKRTMLRLRAWRARSRGHNPELALLPRLAEGGIFLDIGANIGDYSRVAALHFRRVEAFEPIPELAAKLRHDLPDHVHVHEVALGDVAGEAILRVPREGNSKVTGLASLVEPAGQAGDMVQIAVKTARLDSFVFDKVDVIKIDVEGFEAQVLSGAHAVVREHLPVLIVEIEDRHHPGRTLAIFEPLWALGYSSYVLDDAGLSQVSPDSPHWAGVETQQAKINRRPDGSYVNNFMFLHPKGVGRNLVA